MKREYKTPEIEIIDFKANDNILAISVEEALPVFPGGTIYNSEIPGKIIYDSESKIANGSGFGW